jgi:hypothetical protein
MATMAQLLDKLHPTKLEGGIIESVGNVFFKERSTREFPEVFNHWSPEAQERYARSHLLRKLQRVNGHLEAPTKLEGSLPSTLQVGAETDRPSDEIQNGENDLTKKINERVEELDKSTELNASVKRVADQIKQRWTHPDKFREIADSITNILRSMMRGGEVTVKNEELQHYRNNIVNLYKIICEKFPDGKHFDVIWKWVKSTLYNNLRLRMVVY